MAPFVNLQIDFNRLGSAGMLGDHDLSAALGQVSDNDVAVEGLVGDQTAKMDVFEQRGDANRVVTLARQQDKANEIAQGVRQGQDFRRQATLGLADGLILSPPFAPCPWR